MKAKDLIKILEQNPDMDVKIYNGVVDDWMDISVDTIRLVKEKPSFVLKMYNLSRLHSNLPPVGKKDIKFFKRGSSWEFESNYVDYERDKKEYSFKKILLIQGIRRGKTVFDRIGSINY